MMTTKRRLRLAAVVCAVLLGVGACGQGGANGGGSRENPGPPVAGGTAEFIALGEPRSLDPASMSNTWATNAFVGNALYGTLLTNDPATGELKPGMAEEFTSTDGGATFTLKLRPGLKFTDGTPLNAEAVKVNWDRLADRAVGASSLPEASMVGSTQVVDDTTLKVTMRTPVPNYGQAVVSTAMVWIASPTALQAGPEAFNQKPVGAGPYTLKSWQRQGVMELVKNPGFWNAPKPYLDAFRVRNVEDAGQRMNTVLSGGVDIAYETNGENIAKLRDSGEFVDVMPLNGGQYTAMNTRRAPFNDIRARQAVAMALDLNTINQSAYQGKGEIPRTLFRESSPLFTDVPISPQPDRAAAQRLFDELAAEGKPVSFTFKAFSTTETKLLGESIQAQLSTFRNVQVKVETVDTAQSGTLRTTFDFDMLVSSALFVDPEPRLWSAFHGDSRANMTGINDPRLNELLQTGRVSTDQQQRKEAYKEVQQRLQDLMPGLFYVNASPAVTLSDDAYGAVFYGYGSLLPEEFWLKK